MQEQLPRVLSVPKRLRYFLQQDPATATAVLHIFLRALETELRRVSPGAGPKARFGAVSFLHRFGATINPHFHYHCCVLDGVFAPDASGAVRFYEATDLSQARIDAVQAKVRRRVLKAFVRRAWLEPDEAEEMLGWGETRPKVLWTFAAGRAPGQEVRAGGE